MRTIIKSKQPIVKAWKLGDNSHMEQRMIRERKIRLLGPERYEVFSQEALGESGELAAGDYFKVDNAGFHYPNEKAYFEENHIHLDSEDYRQIPRPLKAWLLGDPVTEEIEFLPASGAFRLRRSGRPNASGLLFGAASSPQLQMLSW